jgi:flavorubredoxin
MHPTTDEVADGIFRFSTFPDGAPLVFNQYLIRAEQPMLWHTGMRGLFPLVSEAVGKIIPIDTLRYISFAHFEADESGSMNAWLAAAPNAEVVHGATGILVSLNDQADRPPRILADGEVLDLGGKRVRWIDTPHVPHAWESGLIYEETTGTLFCGDLFTRMGPPTPATTDEDILEPAIEAELAFMGTSLGPHTAPTVRKLADLNPQRLALMHGPVYTGDSSKALLGLADWYDGQLATR